MTDHPYLVFDDQPVLAGRKTKTIWVRARSDNSLLGAISWYSRWRQYVFTPAYDTLFNRSCMERICEEIEALMAERKKK